MTKEPVPRQRARGQQHHCKAECQAGSSAGEQSHGFSDRWTRQIEVLGTVIATTLTALAAIAAVLVTRQQSIDEEERAKEGQITDRYTAAVDNLGDKSAEVRLGGIYALQRIMKDSPRDQPSVVDVLSAYIRSHTASGKAGAGYEGRPEADVQAAFEVLARRLPTHDERAAVDLREAYLPYVGLRSSDGPGFHNGESDRSRLANSNLSGAIFRKATLPFAELRGAHLVGADLEDADLTHADLRSAQLFNADMSRVQLEKAQLRGSSSVDVSFAGASLRGADLRGADMRGVDLSSADLTGADLRGAYLRDARQRKPGSGGLGKESRETTQVTVKQLVTAKLDYKTKLPPDVAKAPEIRKKVAKTEKAGDGDS